MIDKHYYTLEREKEVVKDGHINLLVHNPIASRANCDRGGEREKKRKQERLA